MQFNKDVFFKYRHQFELGNLTTESFHPRTLNLSNVLKESIEEAIGLLSEVDELALQKLKTYNQGIYQLYQACQDTLEDDGRVFIAGCGATGRLALSVETLFREKFQSDQVISFMAGGDYALIKSIERFEDNAEYGMRQLEELGFKNGDLFVGITEGGETSFVIGATEKASTLSQRQSWFLYCNPDEELLSIERSKNVLLNKKIQKLNLCVGPMAISGSTRMQATTVQMLAIGFSLLYQFNSKKEFDHAFHGLIDRMIARSWSFLKDFIQFEFEAVKKGIPVTYLSPDKLAIAILTDTTERSPTFSLNGFEKVDEANRCYVYLSINNEVNAKQAWRSLLQRDPRCLSWNDLNTQIDKEELYKFDISKNAKIRRAGKEISFEKIGKQIQISCSTKKFTIEFERDDLFEMHLSLKMGLNIQSTLLMGLLERFEGNMMSYVRPSNFKLVNRAQRYIEYFLKREGVEVPEEKIIELIFDHDSSQSSPVVISVLEKLGVFL